MTLENQIRPVVVITGASTGIGLAVLLHLLSRNRYFIIGTARKKSLRRFQSQGLEEGEFLKFLPLDITSEKDRIELIKTIAEKWNGIDILINNAGICYRAVGEHTEADDELDQFNINYFGPMRLTRLAIPYMRDKRKGKIINISSVAGMMAMPTMGNYSASKFALEGASESLWYELKPWGISVCIVQPGFVNSNACFNVKYTEKSMSSYEHEWEPYHKYYKYMSEFVLRMARISPATPERIAKKIGRILEKKHLPLRATVTPDAFIFSVIRRILPRSLYHYILYRFLPGIRCWVDSELPESDQHRQETRQASPHR